MTAATHTSSLEDIRREIDAIDDELLELVIRRFEATGRVRANKENDGSLAASPLRPAREANVFRRLSEVAKGRIPPRLLVRLWRVILSASTQSQAAVVLHMDNALGSDLELRIEIAEHFCGMDVETHDRVSEAFAELQRRTGDLMIVATGSTWADDFSSVASPGVQLIGTLPVISEGSGPRLLVFGHAEPLPSGNDETIVLVKTTADRTDLAPRWLARSGAYTIASLPGFLSASEAKALLPGCIVAGRCPCPIEV